MRVRTIVTFFILFFAVTTVLPPLAYAISSNDKAELRENIRKPLEREVEKVEAKMSEREEVAERLKKRVKRKLASVPDVSSGEGAAVLHNIKPVRRVIVDYSNTDKAWQVDEHVKTEAKQLSNVAKSVRELDKNAERLKERVRHTVSRDLDMVMRRVTRDVHKAEDVMVGADKAPKRQVQQIVNESRTQQVQQISERIEQKKKQINDYVNIVVDGSARGNTRPRDLSAVLESSMSDVETIVHNESGVDVDLSSYSRNVVGIVSDDINKFEKQVESLNERGGLDLYRDTDGDGVSNYDETFIYFTDPENAYTSGSTMTDGERILRGLDVHATTLERVAVESPKAAGTEVRDIFDVHKMEVDDTGALVIAGKALPNSFVTLYIFSTPVVVTVKAEGDGSWQYTLDTQLEDGEHSLYVASVNNAGRILAKSREVPFTKTAEAVDFNALSATVSEPTPLSILQENMVAVAIFLLAIFAIVIVLVLGSIKVSRIV